MTIAIGINFGDYVLLAADTRVVYYNSVGQLIDYKDDFEKIYKTSIGLITGAGSVELLGLVNNRFKQIHEIGSTNLLREIVDEEKVHYTKLYSGFPNNYVKEIVEKTGWIFSYVTFAEGTFDRGTQMLRLGVIHPSVEIIGRRHIENNFPLMISPIEATQEDASKIDASLNDVLKPIEQFKTIRDSIQYHGLQIAYLIQKISPDFPSISPYCQIGVHTRDGRRGMSEFVKPGDKTVSIRLTRPRT